jgi:predicted transcriptional regulator of viral defense system
MMNAVLDLADLAAEQWGLVTTAQARRVGVSPQTVARLTNQGALERMTHGVYRLTGTPPSPLDNLRAAWLALEPARRANERLREHAPAVVSHRSAAAIHELGDLEADEFEFTIAERKQSRRPDIRIHRGQIGSEEWMAIDGLPVTTVVRTVADLADAHLDGGHLASVVRDALTRRQADDQQLIDVLRQHAHRYNAPMGDGEALLARLLQESGISEPIKRAVELANAQTGNELRLRQDADYAMQIKHLSEQIASLQRVIASVAGVNE